MLTLCRDYELVRVTGLCRICASGQMQILKAITSLPISTTSQFG